MHGASFSTLFSPEIQLAPWQLPEITWEGIPSSGCFLLSFHERMGKCPCLVLVFQVPASLIVSLFIIPFPANESWAMTLHTAPTTSIGVYDLKKFQRLIQVKLKAVSSYNITWIYSCSFYIGFGWYNTRISHSFVKN